MYKRQPDVMLAKYPEQPEAGVEIGCVQVRDADGTSREVAQYRCIKNSYTPVSYTHLAVYKRQNRQWAVVICFITPEVATTWRTRSHISPSSMKMRCNLSR